MTQGFIMTAEVAEAFFELCLWREAVTRHERMLILEELAAAGRAQWFKSDASKEDVIKALTGKYTVLKVEKKNDPQRD